MRLSLRILSGRHAPTTASCPRSRSAIRTAPILLRHLTDQVFPQELVPPEKSKYHCPIVTFAQQIIIFHVM